MSVDAKSLALLRERFRPEDIEWRIQQGGTTAQGKPWALVLAYVTNRAIQARLDLVCGPENWRNEYSVGPDGGVLCGISIRIKRLDENDGEFYAEWVTKFDGAENTQVEQVKGGLSGAMKRAAVQWGIGRYLYQLETGFANIHENGKHRGSVKDKSGKTHYFKWDPPTLPEWALPITKALEKESEE